MQLRYQAPLSSSREDTLGTRLRLGTQKKRIFDDSKKMQGAEELPKVRKSFVAKDNGFSSVLSGFKVMVLVPGCYRGWSRIFPANN